MQVASAALQKKSSLRKLDTSCITVTKNRNKQTNGRTDERTNKKEKRKTLKHAYTQKNQKKRWKKDKEIKNKMAGRGR